MRYRFDPNATFIAVEVELVGLTQYCQTIFALDTGATQTGVDKQLLRLLGFDPAQAIRRSVVATARGRINIDEHRLPALSALSVDMHDFDVAEHDFGASSFDGVLGKDFFRGKVLTIDFRNGTIELQ
jgi:hypothetical protein